MSSFNGAGVTIAGTQMEHCALRCKSQIKDDSGPTRAEKGDVD